MSARLRAVGPDLRRVNQSALLRLLFLEGPLDRVRLGQMTGLSSGTVTNFVASLLEDGLIIEVGREQSEGGRPRVLLGVNPEYGAVVGVDIGETGIRVEAFDLDLRVIGVSDVALHPQHVDAAVTVSETARAIERLQDRLQIEGRRLLGVGVGVPGMVEHGSSGARVHAPLIGWQDVPLERQLHDLIDEPIFVENGAKAIGQAEMWLGAGRGARDAIVTLWGTGVGAAIFTDGALYRGTTSSAGEWGHTCIVAGGHKCRCGSTGCLEAYIGAESLLDEWRRNDPLATPNLDADDETWAARLIEAALDGGPAAETLEVAANYFGIAAANLANLFNPEVIVISGWLGLALGPAILERIRDIVNEQALDYTASCVRIELGRFRDDAIVLGASSLVVDEMLANGGVVPRGVVRGRPGLLARPR
ncbi:MAG TPA: ROK family transcriptional regulator [Acidimicrobiales bacterium]|nr:ROK family transcriptional regulator [Acidimicrobiales bacterium]